ncbi:PAS domain S-box protein [Pelomonas cellulosilytica]|uniref:histidine kinase n=1 Tax=Pelomonas cellulosilytica TaxID=2906762 RepID=A0ABS8XZI0_9BURK|nr:PAS domain S-box protein [Pelomonas sp. P8]MCE4556675.1 PAS domain S-box protein [Pelomonas sp. P8]
MSSTPSIPARDQHAELMALLTSAPLGVALFDREHRYVSINEALAAINGLPIQAHIGQRIEDLLPANATAVVPVIDAVFCDGEGVTNLEVTGETPLQPGVTRNWLTGFYPVRDDAGHVTAVGAWVTEITDRKAAEQALRRSEQDFRATFDNAAVGIAHVGLDGRWLSLNDRLCDITGYRRDELLAMTFQDITHPDDLAADLEQARRLARGELDTYSMEKRYLRKDGQETWINLTVSARRDAAGQPLYYISIVEDIQARKRAEQALQDALQASQTGTFRWDIQTNRLDWDEALDRLFGLRPGESVHDFAAFLARVHPDDRAGVVERCDRCREHGADFAMEFRVVWPDGREHWLYDRGRTFLDAAGRPAYMTGACVDITERKWADQALRQADRQKDEFLATLAHELRNPLAPMRSALEGLRSGRLDTGRSERALAVMDRQLRHLVRLVDDLLDVSRISSGKIELRCQTLDLAEVVEQAAELARPLIEAADQQMQVALPDAPMWVHGDLTRLAQVVGNLLNNASKYTPAGGHITVSACALPDEAVIEIRDSGMGLAPDMLERIFELFVQAEDARLQAQGGLGIGLSLVKRLVELHGGVVQAASSGLGQGSCFTLRLPLAGAAAPVPLVAAPAPAMASVQKGGCRVLVIDDNVDGAEALQALLDMLGQQTHVAHDGEQALRMVADFRPQIVLCDIGLPGMNGYEVARRLRSEPGTAQALLVALTGWGSNEDRRKSLAVGFDVHLTKPVELSALEALLARAGCGSAPGA